MNFAQGGITKTNDPCELFGLTLIISNSKYNSFEQIYFLLQIIYYKIIMQDIMIINAMPVSFVSCDVPIT